MRMAETRFVEMPIQNPMLIYTGRSGQPVIDMQTDGETVWITQAQLAELFGTSKQNICLHIQNIFQEGELSREATVKEYLIVQTEGNRKVSRNIEHYNLDMIISLGYRVRSQVATHFRQWATARLHEYIVKGLAIDDERLKGHGGGHYWKELLDRIKDIRFSEKVLYRPFMGLLTFSAGGVTKRDVTIIKNYLTAEELKIMNNLVSAYFDLAEVKAMNKEPMHMSDRIQQLDRLVQTFDKSILTDAGSVSKKDADQKAETKYKKYQATTLSPVESSYLESVKALEKKVKSDKKETE